MSEEKNLNTNTEEVASAPRKVIKKKVIVRAKKPKVENNEDKIFDIDLSSYGLRRQARIYAVMSLYSIDFNDSQINREFLVNLEYDEKNKINPNVRQFAKELIEGTINNIERIDNVIEKYSNNWDIERIKYVDKSILRMSIYSLIFIKDIPKSIVIDEAVEISKIFGDKDSYRFINGILDGIQDEDIQ